MPCLSLFFICRLYSEYFFNSVSYIFYYTFPGALLVDNISITDADVIKSLDKNDLDVHVLKSSDHNDGDSEAEDVEEEDSATTDLNINLLNRHLSAKGQRYKCLVCEDQDCHNDQNSIPPCVDAIQVSWLDFFKA